MKIKCINCKNQIFECRAVGREFTGSEALAKDIVPLDPAHPQPVDGEPMVCPICKEPFYFREGEYALLLLEGDAWWPHPPIST